MTKGTASAKLPKGYDLAQYPRFEVTVDVVILTVDDGQLRVLLILRGGKPQIGKWALPGGFKTPTETLDQAAARELFEETNVRAPSHLRQLRTYGDPGRDPRGNVVTVAYIAAVPPLFEVRGGTDARTAESKSVEDVLAGRLPLAFDHRQIVTDAVDQIRRELDHSDIALSFIGPTFTLSELRAVHEAIRSEALDPANFRRSLLNADPPLIEATGTRGLSGSGGGRPPELFRRAAHM